MRKVRWGVLGASNFALTKMVPALLKSDLVELVGIATRNSHKTRLRIDQAGIAKVYDSYEALLADPRIEVVYNPLPNHLHVPWSIKAIEAGKHVLCEKPIGMTEADAQKLLEVARAHPGIKVMEGFMYRHHPQWRYAKRMVDQGSIGELRTIQSFFSYNNLDETNIRNQAEIGGGGLMDIGCYSISLSRFIFGREPQRVLGIIDYDAEFRTDRVTSGVLDFGGGTATFTCSTQVAPYQRVNILGSEGRIEIEIPFNAPSDVPCRAWRHYSPSPKVWEVEEVVFEVCDQYTIQADLFSEAVVEDGSVPTPLEDAIANMRVIDAIRDSHETGRWKLT
jgi:predicted dehydrogenase